jgi:3'(2'), 5'-bisphosphate nucleotidase
VYVPVSGTSYFAARQEGAYAAARAGDPVMIRTRRADPGQLAVVASRDHAGPLVTRLLARLPGASTLSMGSSLKFCLVAEGRADLYLRDVPTMEWDTAAAHCVVNEAGGALLTLENETLSYGKPELRNPAIITVGDSALPWRTYLQ